MCPSHPSTELPEHIAVHILHSCWIGPQKVTAVSLLGNLLYSFLQSPLLKIQGEISNDNVRKLMSNNSINQSLLSVSLVRHGAKYDVEMYRHYCLSSGGKKLPVKETEENI